MLHRVVYGQRVEVGMSIIARVTMAYVTLLRVLIRCQGAHNASYSSIMIAYDGLPAFPEAIWRTKWPKYQKWAFILSSLQSMGHKFPIKIDHISGV